MRLRWCPQASVKCYFTTEVGEMGGDIQSHQEGYQCTWWCYLDSYKSSLCLVWGWWNEKWKEWDYRWWLVVGGSGENEKNKRWKKYKLDLLWTAPLAFYSNSRLLLVAAMAKYWDNQWESERQGSRVGMMSMQATCLPWHNHVKVDFYATTGLHTFILVVDIWWGLQKLLRNFCWALAFYWRWRWTEWWEWEWSLSLGWKMTGMSKE